MLSQHKRKGSREVRGSKSRNPGRKTCWDRVLPQEAPPSPGEPELGSGTSSKESAYQMQETWVQFLGLEDPVEEGMATHSRILAWRIPWTEVPGGLQSMGSQRVRHDWSDLTAGWHCILSWGSRKWEVKAPVLNLKLGPPKGPQQKGKGTCCTKGNSKETCLIFDWEQGNKGDFPWDLRSIFML